MPRRLYIEHRLYSVTDRLKGLDLCERIDRWIDQGLFADMEPCFLPFRDGDDVPEEGGVFDKDIRMINASAGIAGYFDGPTYPPGCGFEIGYGYARGLPVNLVSTDMIKWTVGNGQEVYVGSKLVEHVASVAYLAAGDRGKANYRERQQGLLENAMEIFRQNLARDYGQKKDPAPALEALPVEQDYYLDPNFRYVEAGRMLLEKITAMLDKAGRTYIIGNNQGDMDEAISQLRKSGQAIFWSDVYEPNVDAGILHGIAYGIGRKPLLYSGNEQHYLLCGQWTGWLNAMNVYSAQAVAHSLADLEALVNP